MSAFRIVVTEQSNKELLEMFAASAAKLKGHNKYVEPDVITRSA